MPPAADDKGTDDDDTGTDTGDGEDAVTSRLDRVEAGVTKLLGFLSGRDDDTDDDATDDVEDDDVTDTDDTKAKPRSARQTEVDVESHVRNVLSKVRREEQTDERLSKVEQKVSEEPPEPRVNSLGRFLWGDKKKAKA